MTTKDGGKPEKKDVMNYKPPVGPKGIDDPESPGLHGDEPKHCGTQGRH
jgi:hypothetical protein